MRRVRIKDIIKCRCGCEICGVVYNIEIKEDYTNYYIKKANGDVAILDSNYGIDILSTDNAYKFLASEPKNKPRVKD